MRAVPPQPDASPWRRRPAESVRLGAANHGEIQRPEQADCEERDGQRVNGLQHAADLTASAGRTRRWESVRMLRLGA